MFSEDLSLHCNVFQSLDKDRMAFTEKQKYSFTDFDKRIRSDESSKRERAMSGRPLTEDIRRAQFINEQRHPIYNQIIPTEKAGIVVVIARSYRHS